MTTYTVQTPTGDLSGHGHEFMTAAILEAFTAGLWTEDEFTIRLEAAPCS